MIFDIKEPIQTFLTLSLLSTLTLTSKGRTLVSTLYPSFSLSDIKALISQDPPIECEMQALSLISRDIAVKADKSEENAEIYKKAIDKISKVLRGPSTDKHV